MNTAGLVIYDRDVTYANNPNAPSKTIINHVMKSRPDIGNDLEDERLVAADWCITANTGRDGEPQLHKYWKVVVC